jgi:hypothetical protein
MDKTREEHLELGIGRADRIMGVRPKRKGGGGGCATGVVSRASVLRAHGACCAGGGYYRGSGVGSGRVVGPGGVMGKKGDGKMEVGQRMGKARHGKADKGE